jgi:hypothetical protein
MVFTLFGLLMVSAEPAPPQPPAPKPKLICREGESKTGTHVRTGSRCLTEEQWEEEDSRRDRVPVTLRVTGAQGDGQPTSSRPQ